MSDLFDSLPEEARAKLKKTPQPDWINPMLARLTDDYFSDENWIFERKLDGERCIAYRQGDEVRLMSRNQKRINAQYPEVVEALRAQANTDFIIDGEVVAFDGDVTSFSRLQARMHIGSAEEARRTDVAIYYYAFDLMYVNGRDTQNVPLRHRKALLKRALQYDDPLRYEIHRNTEGEAFLKEACQKGWEGLIAKQAQAAYVHSRSNKWLKFKCVNQQEFVIGGYTEPHGERIGFGALLIGYYHGDDLRYAGKVGTGYDDDTLQRLHDRLQDLTRKSPPFAGSGDLPDKEVHWVTPKLVAEVGFTEWTQHDKLRHPRYLGLRRDKDPRDVVREEPQ